MSKWNEDTVAKLTSLAGSGVVSRETVENIATEMDISARSVASKLRSLDFEVEKVADQGPAFSEEETAQLVNFLENNPGQYTFAEIAEQLGTGHTTKAVQGKVLSLEMTDKVKKTPPKETQKVYTDAEESTIAQMAKADKFLEEIAEALNKPLASIRGKTLAMRSAGLIDEIPPQRDRKGPAAHFLEGIDVANLTVEQIAEQTGKTPRGVKTALTRRGLDAADYKGSEKAQKAAAKAAA